MKMVRFAILTLMVLVILPLGGIAASLSAPLAAPIAVALSVTAEGDQASDLPENLTRMSARKNCRGPFLRGSPCGPDRWLAGAALALGVDQAPVALMPPTDWVAEGHLPAPPREPPRLV